MEPPIPRSTLSQAGPSGAESLIKPSDPLDGIESWDWQDILDFHRAASHDVHRSATLRAWHVVQCREIEKRHHGQTRAIWTWEQHCAWARKMARKPPIPFT
jgi:hypothetical protein